MTYHLLDLWPIIVAGVGVVVWLVRLEGKISANDHSIVELTKRVDANALDIKNISDIKTDVALMKQKLEQIEIQAEKLVNHFIDNKQK